MLPVHSSQLYALSGMSCSDRGSPSDFVSGHDVDCIVYWWCLGKALNILYRHRRGNEQLAILAD